MRSQLILFKKNYINFQREALSLASLSHFQLNSNDQHIGHLPRKG